jgi:hypothetical protein
MKTDSNDKNIQQASENAEFRLEQGEYIQLSPIGVFPHGRGIQNVDRPALETLVKNFKSFFARLGRRFTGVPFYVGHPDVRGYENIYTDRKAYGWIMDVEAREDGLYGRPKWSRAGRELIANGHFKFLSPYWLAEAVGTREGKSVFRPTELISVGLTNEPNLPVLPLANCGDGEEEEEGLVGVLVEVPQFRKGELRESHTEKTELDDGNEEQPEDRQENEGKKILFEIPNTEPAEATGTRGSGLRPLSHADAQEAALAETLPQAGQRPAPTPVAANSEDVDRRARCALPDHAALEAGLANCQEQLAQLHDRFLISVLDNAVSQARIRPFERNLWRSELEADFERASLELANAAPMLQIRARAADLSQAAACPSHTSKSRSAFSDW